ncbi:MAG: hypothetical protein FOGNACKC_00884 [Anaerolineae bacterium]|nr:hypothetical protein [Anaerolineae bacterium]
MTATVRLDSGERGAVKVVKRQQAVDFLGKLVLTRTVFGQKIKTTRHRRGPGGAGDLLNYGLEVDGKIRAALRIGPAPFGNKPVIAALGRELAGHGAYVMRLAGAGISGGDLETFARLALMQFRQDMLRQGRDFRYLVSLDDPKGWMITGQSVFEAPAYAGVIYQKLGALSAGMSKTRRQPTRFVDADGRLRSIYHNGRNLLKTGELPAGCRLVDSGPLQRFVMVLAEPGSLQYRAWRAALPPWVIELESDPALNWVQPRLLTKIRRSYVPKFVIGAQGRKGHRNAASDCHRNKNTTAEMAGAVV